MSIIEAIINIVFPTLCLSCEKRTSDGVICGPCLASIPLNQTLFCGKCGLRLAENKKVCHKEFPYLLGAATDYKNEAVKELVRGLKFRFLRKAAEPLGDFLIRYAESLAMPLAGWIVVPVPLSAARLRERGFNQAEFIAKIFSEHFNLPLASQILRREKNSKPQSETKGLDERRRNVYGSFVVRNSEFVSGKKIILIDDVTTSGATLFEAATVLKSAGAKSILALAAARA